MLDLVAVVLSAGLGTRMGQNKGKLPWPGHENLLHRAVWAAAKWADQVLVVVGPGEDHLDLQSKTINVIRNGNPERGLSSSLRVAIGAVQAATCQTLAWTLVDQPFVTPEDGASVLDHWTKRPSSIRILRPTYNGKPGHPLFIEYPLAVQLVSELHGDVGLSRIISGRDDYGTFERTIVGRPLPSFDIDKPSDYQQALRWLAWNPGMV